MNNGKIKKYDVTIVGSGLSGLILGSILGKCGLRTCILEKESYNKLSNSKNDFRTCAISAGSVNLFKSINIWDMLKIKASPMWNIIVETEDLKVSNFLKNNKLNYNYNDVGKDPLGYIIENKDIQLVFKNFIDNLNCVDIFYDVRIQDIDNKSNCVDVFLKDKTITSGVLVACDGKFSKIRDFLDLKLMNLNYDQSAIVCTVSHSNDHKGLAVEKFLPNGPFALLPMIGNKTSIVWSEKKNIAKKITALNRNEFLDVLKEKIGSYLKDIELYSDFVLYPLSFQHSKNYYRGRTVLVADSAHSIHPVAGQGLNMGIRDIALLSEKIIDAKKENKDIGSKILLSSYENERYFDNASMGFVCDSMVRLFSTDNFVIKRSINIGLGLVDRMPFAKKIFMRHAMGKLGHKLPKFIKKVYKL